MLNFIMSKSTRFQKLHTPFASYALYEANVQHGVHWGHRNNPRVYCTRSAKRVKDYLALRVLFIIYSPRNNEDNIRWSGFGFRQFSGQTRRKWQGKAPSRKIS
uniref:Uncharacterized protein n=1 Tax=Cacopsylla melanoneura TaxID=428564 RepID=A0A8D9FDV5_9HEMI